MPPPMNRGVFFGSQSGSAQATINADLTSAYGIAMQTLQGAGAQVQWQSPPQTIKFVISKRDFWVTNWLRVRFDGDVTIAPVGTRQASVTVSCRPQSLAPLIGVGAAATIAAAFLSVMYGLFMIVVIIGAVGVAFQVFTVNGRMPRDIAQGLVLSMQQRSGGIPVASAAAYAPAPQYAQPQYVPPPPPFAPPPPPPPAPFAPTAPPPPVVAAPPPPPPASPPAANAASIVDQMRQLTALRDMGALSVEEFEAKKAELLRRL